MFPNKNKVTLPCPSGRTSIKCVSMWNISSGSLIGTYRIEAHTTHGIFTFWKARELKSWSCKATSSERILMSAGAYPSLCHYRPFLSECQCDNGAGEGDFWFVHTHIESPFLWFHFTLSDGFSPPCINSHSKITPKCKLLGRARHNPNVSKSNTNIFDNMQIVLSIHTGEILLFYIKLNNWTSIFWLFKLHTQILLPWKIRENLWYFPRRFTIQALALVC